MKLNVIKNAKRNIAFGVINKLVMMVCPFITRTVIRYILGVHYLGLDSLFASIISVLSLSELGFSSAVVYHLYKPVAEGNVKKVNSLLNFYKKAYRVIGCIILLVGLLLIPFLPKLIKGEYPNELSLWKLYIIYLANTCVSYFMCAYLTSIITVYQRDDINSSRNSIVTILLTVFRIALLVLTKNYYCYIIALPLFTIINNLWIAKVVKKQFPQYKCEGTLDSEELSSIKRLVTGTFVQRACSVTRNSLDSICISMMIGLTMTGIYNNYFYIATSITATMTIVINSFTGGIGNHVTLKNKDENFREMQSMDFIYLWLSGWCSICLLCLYQPFMKIWMGDKMLLSNLSVCLICAYFYLLKLGDVRSLYTAANGLWWEQRWRAITETIMNLVLNFTLGYLWGVNGIILATIISLFLCNYIWATRILFKEYYNIDYLKVHYKSQATYALSTLFIAVLTFLIVNTVSLENSIVCLLIKAAICIVLPNIMYYMLFRKNEMFKNAIRVLKRKN